MLRNTFTFSPGFIRKTGSRLALLLFFSAMLLETKAQTVFSIGTGTSTNNAFGFPAPYAGGRTGARHVFMYSKQELLDSGWTTPHEITQLGFNIISLNGTGPYMGFTIKMKFDPSITTLSSFPTGMTTVYSSAADFPIVGWNMKTLSTPMTWDSTQGNVFIEVCFANTLNNETSNASTEMMTTGLPLGTSYANWGTGPGFGCFNNNPNQLGVGRFSGSTAYRPNVRFTAQPLTPMTYISTEVLPLTEITRPGTTNQKITKFVVNTIGTATPLDATDITFSTSGSTNATGDISVARIYYTGLNDEFSTANLYGQIVAPNGPHTISSTQQLRPGANYFWIVYDVSPTATQDDVLNADVISVSINGTPSTPSVTATNTVPIGRLFNFDGTSSENFAGIQEGGLVPNEWQRGAPTFGPTSVTSAPNCWGTNLSGNYSMGADYSLLSPAFLATGTSVKFSYQQWFDFLYTYNEAYANFDYQVNNGGWNTLLSIDNTVVKSSYGFWQNQMDSIITSVNDTVQFRWHFTGGATNEPGAGWYIDDLILTGVNEMPQFYQSSDIVQSEGTFDKNSPNIDILAIEVNVPGTLNPLYIKELEFNTNGSTPAIIDHAKVYYTGLDKNFNTAVQVGSTVSTPSGTFLITDSIILPSGVNYFWLAYDVNSSANLNDIVDAECTRLQISTVDYVPANSAPSGFRSVGRVFNFDTVSTQGFFGTQNGGSAPNEWQKGVPTTGPSSAASGSECWGTNLSGNYSQDANYSLISPVLLATGTDVSVSFLNWFNFGAFYSDITPTFDYQINNGGWINLFSIDNTMRYKSMNWEEVRQSISTSVNDTVQFRWTFQTMPWSTQAPGWYIDNFVVSGIEEISQFYVSSTSSQREKITTPMARNINVLRVEITTAGTANPLDASAYEFNTGGSVPNIIDEAKLFYTGNVDIFDTNTMIGTAVTAPSGIFSFTGSVPLLSGTNYFWLAYSLNSTGLLNDSIDAEFTQSTINTIAAIPSVTAPFGKVVIGRLYDFDTTSDENFVPGVIAGATANQWERGEPNSGPFAAYSGTKCWATKLNDNFDDDANSALTTPPMLIVSEDVLFEFKQWYDFNWTYNDVTAGFEYQINNGGWTSAYDIDNTVFANSNDKWETINGGLAVSVGDTIQFRWKFQTMPWTGVAAGWFIDNFMVSGITDLDQGYLSSTAVQNDAPFAAGARNEVVLKVQVETMGTKNALVADGFDFSTNGSASTPGLITNARLYYTGQKEIFDTTTRFGAAVASPSGPFTFTGSQSLVSGTNYFWLTYDIDPSAALGVDSVDGEFLSMSIASTPQLPTVSAPAGSKKPGMFYDFESAGDQGFSTYQTGGNVPSEWARGVLPTGGSLPGIAFSGTKAWKTNLNGNYSDNSDYALQSPVFIATETSVRLVFEEAFDLETGYDYANIEYQINNGGFNTIASYDNKVSTWQLRDITVGTAIGDTVEFRWRLTSDGSANREGWMIDNVIIGGAQELPMFYTDNEIYQDTSCTASGFVNQAMMRIIVKTNGSSAPLAADYFKFNTNGTTDATQIVNAKLYYTGTSKAFVTSPSSLFGQVSAPNGSFTITGSQQLGTGDNFFWLVYDLAPGIPMGNLFDAEIDSIGVNGTLNNPVTNAPLGARRIATGYDFEAAGTQGFTTEILNGMINQWEKGTPSGGSGAPATAYSGSNCWATNISGNYAFKSSYALISPTFIATADNIRVAFDHIYNTNAPTCGSNADLAFDVRMNSGGWSTLGTFNGQITNWEQLNFDLGNLTGDTITIRWTLSSYDYCTPQAGWYVDDLIFSDVTEIDVAAPVISYEPLTNSSTLVNRVLTGFAAISDFTGVDSTTFAPRIYYKKYSEANIFGANNNTVDGWKYAQASNLSSPFSFTIDYSLLNTPVVVGDTIQYFVVAQDVTTAALLSASPSDGFSGTTVDVIASAPAEPNQYQITLSPLSGTYNVGSGQVYTTITAAINDLNNRGVSGAVTFALTDNSYTTAETFPITINNVAGASAANMVTIKPTLSNTVISGNNTDAIIKLNDTRYIKLNGSVSGSANDLTIENTSVNQSPVIWFASNALIGCRYDSVMNCNIKAGSDDVNNTGIRLSGGTSSSTSGNAHQYITLMGNHIYKAYAAIYIDGASTIPQHHINILNNTIGSGTSGETVKYYGIWASFATDIVIKGNTIYNLYDNNTGSGAAIMLQQGCANGVIENNKIDSMVCTIDADGHMGIRLQVDNPASNIMVVNNMISRIYSRGYLYGIYLSYNVGGVKVYNNTVDIESVYPSLGTYDTWRTCLYTDGGGVNVDIRNNIFINTGVNPMSAGGKSFAIVTYNIPSAFSFLDYNNYKVGGSQAMLAYFNTSMKPNMLALRTASGKDVHSSNEPVSFVSSSDLHLAGASIGNFALAGTPLAAVPLDIDGQTRSLIFPYKGADENATPLPVQLTSFVVSRAGTTAILKWTTASEINNNYFAIERSVDMKNFESIGQVKGQRNSNTVTSYSFTDRDAALVANKGTIYYRLRQVDFNAQSQVSDVKAVNFNDKVQSSFMIYPNPFVQSFNMMVTSAEKAAMHVSVVDIQGRILIDKMVDLSIGDNTVIFDQVSSLSQGIYMIRTDINGQIHTQKLIKTEQ